MVTELGFLLDLLLEHDLKPDTRKLVAGRIKEVEQNLTPAPPRPLHPFPATADKPAQAASTMAILARNPDLAAAATPPAIVAQTPAAVAAMESRQRAISESINGKVDKVTGRPRKF